MMVAGSIVPAMLSLAGKTSATNENNCALLSSVFGTEQAYTTKPALPTIEGAGRG